jgi:parallel beta-helix repeat protein
MSFSVRKDGIMSTKHAIYKVVTLCFLLLSSIILLGMTHQSMAGGREIYVNDAFTYPRDGSAEHPYKSITEAIDLANDGDTIYVFGGSYNESLKINKRLSIIGGIDDVPSVIFYGLEHYYTVDITADFVSFENFTVTDPSHIITSQRGALIHVSGDNVVIQKNNISFCTLWGVYLDASNDNMISGNFINTTMGIYVSSSNNNVLSSNNITNSSDSGIKILSSTKNIVYDNLFHGNNIGLYTRNSVNTNITGNTFFENKFDGLYLYGDTNDIISGNTCVNNTVSGMNVASSNCYLADNVLRSNQVGIVVQQSRCQVKNNTFINQSGIGLSTASGSSSNVISLNRFLKNAMNAKENGHNQWDDGERGNYWSDYKQIDRDLDGIGDAPYYISGGGIDYYPIGAFLRSPYKPLVLYPADDAEGVGLKVTLKVLVIDPDSQFITVDFYNAVGDVYLGHALNVQNNSNATLQILLPFDATFAWYAIANDSQLENQSDIWFFTTKQRPPQNEKPVSEPGGPYQASINQMIQLNGSSSYDPDGTIIFYRWNFGDGSSEILDSAPLHSFTDPGTYTVTLTVVDNEGRSSMSNTTVVIGGTIFTNEPPVAQFFANPSPGRTNQVVLFNASLSHDANGTITGYRWDFNGDGVFDTPWSMSPVMSHSYTTQGSYFVKLEVKDNENVTGSYSLSVSIQPVEKKSPGFETSLVLFGLTVALLLVLYRRR